MTTKIIGTGSSVPERVVTNDDLAKIVETNDEWIRTRTGIRERRIASEESGTSHMAEIAAREAIKQAGISAEDLDIIVLATSSADYCFPSGACEVQAAIGAKNAVAFDISAACSGFIFGLNTVHSFFKAGIYKTGLVIGADTLSKLIDWKDRGTCVLFGDGAGAAVVRAEETGLIHMVMGSDGSRGSALECRARTTESFLTQKEPELGYMTMDGQEVFKFAVKTVPEAIKKVLSESGTPIDEIKYFILHQANYRIFESIAKRLKIPMEKFPTNLDRFGNTSAATVPILLDEMNREGKLEPGDKVILAGFGAGLTWGATLLEW
ncbi:beta-ketoacyl-ACP synthase III [Clostridium sp. HBUAS56010]|uniref:beta-ketoacyl-ACP synthase III n=1 Tax=Clostridium sp. HBUAS56010 TaxID=2571127 RepID=UPI001177452A|nr:beta-ketoacyl-ACP synthase III [Clostridium sp. HBUAS56010]